MGGREGSVLGKARPSPSLTVFPAQLSKAPAFWQWYNYLESMVEPGQELLRINLDETSICAFQGHRRGILFRNA